VRGYGLKGLYALEAYYAQKLEDYYEALTIGPFHNYYLGRVDADITKWIAYFVEGMAVSFQKVESQARAEAEEESGPNPYPQEAQCQAAQGPRTLRAIAGGDSEGDRRSVRIAVPSRRRALPELGGRSISDRKQSCEEIPPISLAAEYEALAAI